VRAKKLRRHRKESMASKSWNASELLVAPVKLGDEMGERRQA
jgi:hypothetical protein